MDTRTQRLMAEVIGSLADRERFLTQLGPALRRWGLIISPTSCFPVIRPAAPRC